MNRKLKSGEIIYVMFRAMPGKWISTGTDNPEEAEIWAANYEVTVQEEISAELTLKEFTRNFYITGRCPWLRRMQAKGQTFSSLHIKRMRSCLENYILPGFGNLILPAIRQGAIDDYLLDIKSTRDGRTPLKAEAKNKILTAFRHIMREAVTQGILERDPTQGMVWYQDIDKVEQEIFSPEELGKLFPHDLDDLIMIWGSLEWAAYFMVMGSAGLRPQEVGALTWGKWSRTLHGLAITQKVDPDTKKIMRGTKTGYTRAVTLPRRAEELLLLHEATSEHTEPSDQIFTPQEAKGGVQSDTSNKHFKASCDRAGIDRRDRTQYNLRHSFNTYALQILDRKETQGLMGHRTEAMTRRYDHPTDQQLIERIPEGVRDKINQLWE